MATLKEMMEKNAAESVGLFLEKNIQNALNGTLVQEYAKDPKLAKLFDGINPASINPNDLLIQFQQHVQNELKNKLKHKPTPGSGGRKLVDEFDYVPKIKPSKP